MKANPVDEALQRLVAKEITFSDASSLRGDVWLDDYALSELAERLGVSLDQSVVTVADVKRALTTGPGASGRKVAAQPVVERKKEASIPQVFVQYGYCVS
jgi:hypothetical protein